MHVFDARSTPLSSPSRPEALNNVFVLAWAISVVFYFTQYAMRSAPGVMLPELSATLGAPAGTVTTIIGLYFYTYALSALVSGAALDRIGPRAVIPCGIALLSLGSILFSLGLVSSAAIGRLLQGAGSGVAFTGAVYLATRGFPKAWLATAIGVTQCIGMLGGSLGQSLVAPLVHSSLGWQPFWLYGGGVVILMAMALLAITPRLAPIEGARQSLLAPYKVVLGNPQSYLCGLVAGMLFMPTNIADMIWGVPFLQHGWGLDYRQAVNEVAMIPLGWVIGCPLLGYLADHLGRRKPVLIGGAVAMLLLGSAIVYLPADSVPPYLAGLLFGIASGAAMIPYSIIKEVNPDSVKGSATGTINFIVFSCTALATPLIGHLIVDLGGATPTLAVFRQVDLIYVGAILLAIVLSCFIRETGSRCRPAVAEVPR